MIPELNRPRRIIIYGRDPILLETRGWVLERSGCGVRLADSLDIFKQTLEREPICLVVLCYTLSVAECQAAFAALQSMSPKTKKLLLTASQRDAPHGAVETLSSSEGPRVLIDVVKKMLEL